MEEFDVREFARMFDAALASDNPSVKKALRNFMMVAALVHAQELDNERNAGPFETLIKKVSDLERMYWDLKNTTTISTAGNYWRDAHLQNPTWVYKPTTTSVSTTSSGTSASFYGNGISTISVNDISDYLKDLKIT
jgi:hypothetical protein